MAKEVFYTSVDIGTSKVCSIVARVGTEGELKVLGAGVIPSRGVQKGCIENLADVRESVRESIQEAQRYVGKGSNPGVYVVVSGEHIASWNTKAVMRREDNQGGVTHQQMRQFIHSSLPQPQNGQELLHLIPIGYSVDGLSGVRNPAGLHANQVEMEAHIVAGDATIIKNTVNVLETNRIPVNSLVLQSLASAEATLTADEREMGVALVDLGSGTTDLTIFQDGSPWHSTVLPVGGSQLTRDLAVAERIPFHLAEELKVKWGNVFPELIEEGEEVVIPGVQGQPRRVAQRHELCETLNLRMLEILQLITLRITQAGLTRLPDGGLVFTGGAAEIRGLAELAKKLFGGPVRIAYPQGVAGLPAQLRKPGFSASVGSLLWGIKHQGERRSYRSNREPESSSIRGHMQGYKNLLSKFKLPREKATG